MGQFEPYSVNKFGISWYVDCLDAWRILSCPTLFVSIFVVLVFVLSFDDNDLIEQGSYGICHYK